MPPCQLHVAVSQFHSWPWPSAYPTLFNPENISSLKSGLSVRSTVQSTWGLYITTACSSVHGLPVCSIPRNVYYTHNWNWTKADYNCATLSDVMTCKSTEKHTLSSWTQLNGLPLSLYCLHHHSKHLLIFHNIWSDKEHYITDTSWRCNSRGQIVKFHCNESISVGWWR